MPLPSFLCPGSEALGKGMEAKGRGGTEVWPIASGRRVWQDAAITMNPPQAQALMTLCLRAAFADGETSDAERAQIRRILEGLSHPDLNLATVYQDVLLRRPGAREAAAALDSPDLRQLAYEMAVCTCESDGLLNAAERAHLTELRTALRLDDSSTAVHQQADALQSTPLQASGMPPIIQRVGVGSAPVPPSPASPSPISGPDSALDREIDRSILNCSILNGALELLPDSLATMAIIPVQMKMVYGIGKRHGFELDRGHIKEFVAAAGIGMTSQVLEGYATKLAKGLLGKFAGGIGKMVAGQVTSSAMSFATTYALGQVAKRYYGGGRTLSGMQLRELFTSMLGEARQVQSQHLAAIQSQSRSLSRASLLELVRRA